MIVNVSVFFLVFSRLSKLANVSVCVSDCYTCSLSVFVNVSVFVAFSSLSEPVNLSVLAILVRSSWSCRIKIYLNNLG